jgi:hypothetical protein
MGVYRRLRNYIQEADSIKDLVSFLPNVNNVPFLIKYYTRFVYLISFGLELFIESREEILS